MNRRRGQYKEVVSPFPSSTTRGKAPCSTLAGKPEVIGVSQTEIRRTEKQVDKPVINIGRRGEQRRKAHCGEAKCTPLYKEVLQVKWSITLSLAVYFNLLVTDNWKKKLWTFESEGFYFKEYHSKITISLNIQLTFIRK